ncbi:MAG: V-type ATP synthase subunit D [Lentisphaeria bacterium]|jgi:V/A-type H+-transporting ATPase subunit D|nr:V-type ATP synthase subunit D [Lentisphaeria bacterium]MDY0175774.1 V-type ATP synthase subunit D [Lentisphaeria bacterium]NLZ59829.1 V-type ATP synthase subunit D [Lentisphaerota bacterium]
MSKIKLTKNELKLQRDGLKRFQLYLPTLQLKQQQLQAEVSQIRESLAALDRELQEEYKRNQQNLGLFSLPAASGLAGLLEVSDWQVGTHNVAGTDVPVFVSLTFAELPYDLFSTPLWFDEALAMLKKQIELRLRRQLIEEQLELLGMELRIVTQRVNLFEKVKIPEALDNIRRINIYIGDQQTNSVGRSKIAKKKCQIRDAALA